MRLTTPPAIGLALVGAFACSGVQAALIDNFNDTTQSVSAGAGGTDSSGLASLNLGNEMVGDFRQMNIPGGTVVSGLNLAVDANPGGIGVLAFSLNALSSGSVKLTWDANGTGLGTGLGVDLTDGGTSQFFTFDILSIDQGNVDLIVSAADGTTMDSASASNAGVGTFQFGFDQFDPLLDFTSITSVMLEIQGRDASDLVLDQFSTAGSMGPTPDPMPSVPAPGSLALLGLGLVSLRRFAR